MGLAQDYMTWKRQRQTLPHILASPCPSQSPLKSPHPGPAPVSLLLHCHSHEEKVSRPCVWTSTVSWLITKGLPRQGTYTQYNIYLRPESPHRLPAPWELGLYLGHLCVLRAQNSVLWTVYVWCVLLVAQSCPTLCDPVDCSWPGSPVHRILQARVLQWAAVPRASSWLRDQSWVSCIAGRFFTFWATSKVHWTVGAL